MNMTIIIYMNIYITKDNEEFLKSITEGSMSGIINKLLNNYRKGNGPDLFPKRIPKPKIINSVQDVKNIFPEAKAQKFCKEGHPVPEGRTKCLGKGCRYS